MHDERLPVAKTGGKAYQHYRWEAFGPFPFRKGTNRIRLLADKNEAYPRLDALKIVKDSVQHPKPVWKSLSDVIPTPKRSGPR